MSADESLREAPSRAGLVALGGAPNVGKSTLLNRILGRPLSIATPKPQTTRRRLLGVETRGEVQMVLCDTPGIHTHRGLLHDRMNAEARQGLRDADVVCWLVDAARGLGAIDREEIARLAGSSALVVLNKCDRVAKPKLLPLMREVAELAADAECYPISALAGDGVDALVERLLARMPEGPWLFDPDTLTDRSERFLVAELVREQVFLQLEAELPYRVAVAVDFFREGGRTTAIGATIFTDSDSSKRILVGKGGARIKSIGTQARRAIEELLGRHVHLELFVKVRPGWQEDPRFLEEIDL